MFGSYQPALFWWEYVIIARRLALAMAVTLVPFTQQQLSSVIIMTVLVVSIALQHTFSPFATKLENRLEQLSLYVLLLAFLGIYVTDTSAGSSTPLEWLPVLVIVLVSITAIILLLATVFVLGTRLVPSLAETSLGFRLLSGSETLSGLVSKTHSLQESLLGERSDLDAAL
jgi:predicted Na+-dependent transporter